MSTWRERLAGPVAAQKFLQFAFFEQWRELREYCRARGVRIMGDLPIYISHDSADVWANRQYFHLDALGNPTAVSYTHLCNGSGRAVEEESILYRAHASIQVLLEIPEPGGRPDFIEALVDFESR